MVLRGDICTLRSVESKDIDTILLWENDPAVASFSAPHEPYSRYDIEQFVRIQQQGFFINGQLRLMIEVKGLVVGAIDLFDYNGWQAEVGVLIYNEQHRNKGYASAALQIVTDHADEMQIRRLKAVVDTENLPSRTLFERCGFVKTDNFTYICNMKRIIAPSILSADFGNLERDIRMLDESRAEWVHVDVMDGVFVPNISFGFPVLKPVRQATKKIVDTHLMICDPIRYVKRFVEAGSDYVTFHYEATDDIDGCIDAIHAAGAKAGISIKPATDVRIIEKWLAKLDLVLIMSVEPGFGGQSFIPSSLEKVRTLREMIDTCGADCLIEIDGGISEKNAGEIFTAGADVLVAGSSVFGAEDQKQAIVKMLEAK
jgi:ribulose-phosphate 3-epimerase